MKKNSIKGFLVLLVCLFVFPMLVSADMGAPEVTSYEVRINNINGTSLYDYYSKVVGTIPYDTKVTVFYEYEDDGKLYGSIEYKGKNYEIDLADAEVFSDKIDLTKFAKSDEPVKLYVFGEGCYMYKGPSKVYGKVDKEVMIPVGKTVEYEYRDDLWSYVEYDGVKGWIPNSLYGQLYEDVKNNVAYLPEEGAKLYTVNNIKELYKAPYDDDTIDVDIPVDTELKYDYYVGFAKSMAVHVSYKDAEGWINVYGGDYGEDTKGGALSTECGLLYVGNKDGIYVYKNPRDVNSKTSKVFEYGKILDMKYSFMYDDYYWYQVSDDGKEYWVAEKFDDKNWTENLSFNGWASVIELKNKAVMYEEFSTDSKILFDNIPSGTKVTSIFITDYDDKDAMIYAEYEGQYGWIKVKNYEYKDSVKICANNSSEEPEITEEPNQKDDKKDDKKEKKSMSIKMIAMIAVAGAVVLALVMAVIIKIVNKRKVNNN